ncbi:MAG TPA: tetratricopeptide repeat protein [Anaerolineae bacterium]|nr:tetratricopeptide repeat protein [Anaerolineae bacterium]
MVNPTAKKSHDEAVNLFRQGQLEAARDKLQEALQLAADGTRQQAEIYNDLGVVYTQLQMYEAADEALDKAMEGFIALADRKGQGQTLGNLAALCQAEDELEEAVEIYKESAQILEEVGESEMAMYAWQAISKIRMKQGQYIAAIGAYEEGVENMPQSSFKRKILSQILKAPTKFIGGSSGGSQDKE